ncbi:pyroglutamyl peptidase, partial [Streptomyces sp. SID161]|nr:pyroglutamyl peptidase [Streptomyces sp. SID161]
MTSRRVRLGVPGLALLTALTALCAPATTASAAASAPTTEEQRLERSVPHEILRRSGFDTVAPEFGRALAGAH